jgi:nucleotide-binding universal stress UspA family protein
VDLEPSLVVEIRLAMSSNNLLYAAALRDFQDARRRAAMQDLLASITGKSDNLLSYRQVSRLLNAEGKTDRGVQEIPLAAIVGSVGRYNDFTRTFLPRKASNQERWAKIKLKATYEGGLPPIEVYKVGEVYFVLDGNHRVSVVRELGGDTIMAHVTEVHTRVPLQVGDQADDLIIKARYAQFLERTGLDISRPQAGLTVTAPGQYRHLEEQIGVHRRMLALQRDRTVSWPEAAQEWHDHVFLPVIRIIRDRGIMDEFPGRTETDLYVWISQHQDALKRRLGWNVRPDKVVEDLVGPKRPRFRHIMDRLGEQSPSVVSPASGQTLPAPGQSLNALHQPGQEALFPDVLVPISGTERSWLAVEQALLVARREGSTLHGFHVVRSEADRSGPRAREVQREFDRRCRQAGIPGQLSIEKGPVAKSICDRARWTDLVIANLAHPPGPGFVGKTGSGFLTLIRRCSRPILAVPNMSPLSKMLLAYDGSRKAREGLFMATYLAGHWKIPLTVVTVLEKQRTGPSTLDEAQRYLQTRGVSATFREEHGSVPDSVLQAAAESGSDLIVMGGFGYSPVVEMVLGSALDRLLRESPHPLLICR